MCSQKKRIYSWYNLISNIKFILLLFILSFSGCGSEFEILLQEQLHEHSDAPVIYWTEVSGTVKGINPDGSGLRTIYTSLNPTPFYVDIDVCDNKVYWAAFTDTSYQIKRVNFDGTSKEDVYSYSNSDGFGPSSLAIDKSNTAILFNQYVITNPHANQNANTNYIMRSVISEIPLNPVNRIPDINYKYIYSICVDSINRKIYYSANSYYVIAGGTPYGSGNNGSVYIGELDTIDSYHQITSLTGVPGNSVPIKGIAVDGNGGHVYYVTHTSHGTWPINITRTDLLLQNAEVWIYQGVVADIDKIALDLKNRKIYWTSESDNSIYRADLDAPDSNVEKFLSLGDTPTGIAISQ